MVALSAVDRKVLVQFRKKGMLGDGLETYSL
jgi:hypothetical protein